MLLFNINIINITTKISQPFITYFSLPSPPIKYQYNHAGFFYNKAMALNNLKEHLLAIDNYYQALKYKPDYFGDS